MDRDRVLCPPEKRLFDHERDISRLVFPRDSIAGDGDYCMRGGVCWPIPTDSGGLSGYAVMCGRNQKTGHVFVFREIEFSVVDTVIDIEDQAIFHPLGPWLNDTWSRYFAYKYYWRQDAATARQWVRSVFTSRMVEPKPSFIEVAWSDENAAMSILYLLAGTGKISYTEDGGVCRAIQLYNANPDPSDSEPALRALVCAMFGLNRIPLEGSP